MEGAFWWLALSLDFFSSSHYLVTKKSTPPKKRRRLSCTSILTACVYVLERNSYANLPARHVTPGSG